MTNETSHEYTETLVEPVHPVMKKATAVFGAILTAACIAWAMDVPSRLGVAFYTQQLLALSLGLGLAIVYFSVSWRGKPNQSKFPWLDVILGLLGLGISLWICVEYQRLLDDVPYYTPEVVWLSVLIMPLVLEALRRCTERS